MQNYILYHAVGSPDRINECRYALLKYLGVYNLKPPADTHVILITDKPVLFESYIPFFSQFILQERSGAEIAASKVLDECLATYPGNFLYCQPDSYPVRPLEPLFAAIQNGQLVLYEPTSQPDSASLLKPLHGKSLYANNQQILLPHALKLWNTCTIGVNSNDRELVKTISLLSEALLQNLPTAAADQVAFSYFASQKTALSARNYFAPYQGLKEFKTVLNLFFKKNEEESIPNLVKLIAHLNAADIEQEKARYERLPFYKKLANKLLGRGWSINQYTKKI